MSVSESTPATTDFSIRLPTVLKGAGSIRYSSPEQMLGSTPDPRDDVFSLGVIAYQLLVGSLQAGHGRGRLGAPVARRGGVGGAGSAAPPPPAAPGADEFARAEAAARSSPADTAAALKLYALAVNSGHAGAALALGRLYAQGRGPGSNPKLAREWYEKAAALGSSDAAFARGELSDSSRDFAGAKEWYERAATAGHTAAQYALGVLYRLGRGVKQDYVSAHDWIEKAAAQGHEVAQFTLGLQYDLGQGVAASTALAREWYLKAAAQGNADAANTLGEHHEAGRGMQADAKEALRWYQIAASKGHAGAKRSIERLTRRKR